MGELDRREFLARTGRPFAVGGRAARARRAGAVDPRLRALARDVRGPVITPADAAYAPRAARLQRALRRGPAARASSSRASVADVRQPSAGRAARRAGSPRAPAATATPATRRRRASSSTSRRLDGIAMHATRHRRRSAPARGWSTSYAALARRGRAIPTGSCPTVGIAGLALGGGVGLASRAWGTTSDNVVALGIVTADGRHLDCDAHAAPRSLLGLPRRRRRQLRDRHALRASGRTRSSRVSYFFATLAVGAGGRGGRAPGRRSCPHAPDGLFAVCSLGAGGERRRRCACSGQFLGAEAQLRKLLAPLARRRRRRGSRFGSSSYLDAQLRWAGCLGKRLAECHLAGETPHGTLGRASFRAKSDYVNGRSRARGSRRCATRIERAQTAASARRRVLLDSYGGAINRVTPGATAFVHRDALCSVQYLAYWYGPPAPPARPRGSAASTPRCGRTSPASRTRTTSTATSPAGSTPTTARTTSGCGP